jgi:hypothetical protein
MQELKDGFTRALDKEKCGIDGKCRAYITILRVVDPLVHRKLIEEKIQPVFYSLKWIMLLCCQEFDMFNCITLWDSLFSDDNRFELLSFICCAMTNSARQEILDGDFAACMENLQRASSRFQDVQTLIRRAW